MLNRIHCKLEQKGFSLIELMVVVAIIGILAAIAIPNFRNYQLKTKLSELPTNLKSIRTAEVSYQAEFSIFQPLTRSPAGALSTGKRGWTSAGGFDTIGWQPSGNVYGAYAAASASASNITGNATSDIDGDGNNATYDFRVDIVDPSLDYNVNRTTGMDVF